MFRLTPGPRARLEAYPAGESVAWDARIAGPLAALIGLVHGAYDGDALFFSRDLVIEGDTEAVLALRNAIDNEELDLAARRRVVRTAGDARRRACAALAALDRRADRRGADPRRDMRFE